MGAFGDHTAKQDLLEAIITIRDEHNLSFFDVVNTIIEVLAYIVEYWRPR